MATSVLEILRKKDKGIKINTIKYTSKRKIRIIGKEVIKIELNIFRRSRSRIWRNIRSLLTGMLLVIMRVVVFCSVFPVVSVAYEPTTFRLGCQPTTLRVNPLNFVLLKKS